MNLGSSAPALSADSPRGAMSHRSGFEDGPARYDGGGRKQHKRHKVQLSIGILNTAMVLPDGISRAVCRRGATTALVCLKVGCGCTEPFFGAPYQRTNPLIIKQQTAKQGQPPRLRCKAPIPLNTVKIGSLAILQAKSTAGPVGKCQTMQRIQPSKP